MRAICGGGLGFDCNRTFRKNEHGPMEIIIFRDFVGSIDLGRYAQGGSYWISPVARATLFHVCSGICNKCISLQASQADRYLVSISWNESRIVYLDRSTSSNFVGKRKWTASGYNGGPNCCTRDFIGLIGWHHLENKSIDPKRIARMASKDRTPAVKVSNLTKIYRTNAVSRSSSGLSTSLNLKRFLVSLFGKRTSSFTALNDVSFEVPRGSIFGLLGPNGAGKTTIVKILSTLILGDSGKVFVNGFDVQKRPYRVLKELQTVLSEGFGFERRLTGRQNLEFYASLYGLGTDAAQRKIDSLLELVGLPDKGHLAYQRYSTGMARRLLVCRALLSEASVLIFDEPTSGMDPGTALDFRTMVLERLSKKEGRTIVLTTHNMWEAQQVCDLIGVLDKGKMVAIGTPDEIRRMVGEKVVLSLTLGGSSIFNETRAPLLVREVTKVHGVANVSLNDNGSSDSREMQIEGVKDLDYSKIFSLLLNENVKIRFIESTQPSLEDAFMFLTKKAKK